MSACAPLRLPPGCSRGAQTADTKLLFNTSKEEYEARAHIVEAAYIYKGCAIALSDELEAGMNVVLPMAANDLLTINGVDASFNGSRQKQRRQHLGAQHGRAERAGHSGAAGRRRPSDDGGCSAPELHRCRMRSTASVNKSTFTARRKRKILRGNCDKNFGRETLAKIILKQDVKTIGKKTEIHEVSDGRPQLPVPAQPGSPRMPQH